MIPVSLWNFLSFFPISAPFIRNVDLLVKNFEHPPPPNCHVSKLTVFVTNLSIKFSCTLTISQLSLQSDSDISSSSTRDGGGGGWKQITIRLRSAQTKSRKLLMSACGKDLTSNVCMCVSFFWGGRGWLGCELVAGKGDIWRILVERVDRLPFTGRIVNFRKLNQIFPFF